MAKLMGSRLAGRLCGWPVTGMSKDQSSVVVPHPQSCSVFNKLNFGGEVAMHG
tara:strand:+ start:3116 stop:3274 length:159 start_codon:yes stop_codon:yes gene_type:complete